jgi:hypothetical protein
MSTHADASSKNSSAMSSLKPVRTDLLQRKCSCGGSSGLAGECERCSSKKRFGLQTKLKVNEPGDIYEQEADHIAEQVMATPAHHAVSGGSPRIQRFSGQSNGEMDTAPASVDQALASSGRPLEPALRYDMEQRFSHDFSRVRVHSGDVAEQSARDVNANAYTVGDDIVFGAGRFAPASDEGRRLIAHELTHVVQQNGSQLQRALVQRKVLQDISLEAPDFWTHLRSRTYTRLLGWIGDSRQKLNEFAATMGEAEGSSPWGDVIQGWIGTLGTPGDVVNAMITSLGAISAGLDSPMNLFEFRSAMEKNLDQLSMKVNDMESDLPIYRILRDAEAATTEKDATAHKARAREQLEGALTGLPSPMELQGRLIRGWVQNRTQHGKTAHMIYCYAWFDLLESDEELVEFPQFQANEASREEVAYLLGPENAKILKMLPDAFGKNLPVHKLGFPISVIFYVTYALRERFGTWGYQTSSREGPYGVSGYKLDGNTWVPLGKIEESGRKAYHPEARHAVFSEWLAHGRIPTIANLKLI